MSPDVLGYHSDANDDPSLVGSCTVATGKQSPTFRRSYSRHLRLNTDPRTDSTDTQYTTGDINRSTTPTFHTFTCGSGWGPVALCCEDGNEPSVSIQGLEI